MTRKVPDFAGLARPHLAGLRAYDPGHDIVALRRKFPGALIEAGSNENPYGPGEAALKAVRACMASLNRYPDPLGSSLKAALACTHGLPADHFLLGNGSHELLMMVAQVFAGPGAAVLASEFGFAVYAIAAHAAGAPLRTAPALPADHVHMPRGHDLGAISAAVEDATRIIYLANPNNPTGTWFSPDALEALLSRLPERILVVVDEAYMEYATDASIGSALPLLERCPNLVVMRTFSKAHGLAGLRVGYACAHPALLAVMERVRESFNVNLVGLAAAKAALSDTSHLERVRRDTTAEREWLAAQLRALGLKVGPSQANFLLVDFGINAAPLESVLVGRGIVLRPMAGYGLPESLRITVGTRSDNLRLLEALRECLP